MTNNINNNTALVTFETAFLFNAVAEMVDQLHYERGTGFYADPEELDMQEDAARWTAQHAAWNAEEDAREAAMIAEYEMREDARGMIGLELYGGSY